MKVDIYYIFLFLISVMISSVSQVILKKKANVKCESWIKEYLNVPVILAYSMFFGASLLTVLAYRKVPLTLGPVLESTGYVWVAFWGYFFLKERISKRKLVGIGLIIIGILVFNISM